MEVNNASWNINFRLSLAEMHKWPSVFVSFYTRGTNITKCWWSVFRELLSARYAIWGHDRRDIPAKGVAVIDEPIIGKSVLEANREMARRFVASGLPLLLHVDDDQELPPGSLEQMIHAIVDADVVTLHAINRGRDHRGKHIELWREPDNHIRSEDNRTLYFAIAVALIRRRVFEVIPEPWFVAGPRVGPYGPDSTGEISFSSAILNDSRLKHVALPIVSPHHEIVVFRGAGDDFRFDERHVPGGHEIIVYW